MGPTWLQTTRRLLPRLARLSREIRPTVHLDSVAELRPADLRERGFETLLWDVDGTLMSHHAERVAPEVAEAFSALMADPALRHAIVSNCQPPRFADLARIFPRIPIVLGYETGEGPAFQIRHGAEERWTGPGASRARAQAARGPLRKPSARLVRAALEAVGASDRPERAVLVGDQYFTDIASANLAGIRSIKVPTIEPASFPFPVRLSQRLEKIWYRLRFGAPRPGWTA